MPVMRVASVPVTERYCYIVVKKLFIVTGVQEVVYSYRCAFVENVKRELDRFCLMCGWHVFRAEISCSYRLKFFISYVCVIILA